MKLTKEKIENIVSLYAPDWRFLDEVEIEYEPMRAKGIFTIPKTTYTSEPLEHIALKEAENCLDQLSATSFYEWICAGKIKGLEISLKEYKVLVREYGLMSDFHIKFRELMDKNHPICVEIELKKLKKLNNTIFGLINYNFEKGKAEGKFLFSLKY